MSTTGVITASGTKGLMQYLKSYQPEFYEYLGPRLIAAVKQNNQRHAMSGLLACYDRNNGGGMGRMGDAYTDYASNVSADIGGTTVTNPAYTDFTVGPNSYPDAASAASSAPTSAGIANIISSLANAYTSTTLTQAQVSANNTLLQTNLERAQQGLPPLTAVTGSSGLTSITDPTTMLLIGGAVLAVVLMGKKSKAKS